MAQAKTVGNDPIEKRKRYLAMLSHDLRSALSGMIGSLSQVQDDSLSPVSAKHIESALASAADATRLLDGIVDIEAIEKDAFELSPTRTETEAFLTEVNTRWHSRAQAKGISLDVVATAAMPAIFEVDRIRLSRIVGNLVENAIKYTDVGDVSVIADMKRPGIVSVTVHDQGPGFSDQAIERLFSYRGRPENASKPGSGLGLHIAKSLIDQMGGKIDISNDAGGRVEVTVPVSRFESSGTGTLTILPTTQLPDLSGMTILLAEDNTTNQMVVTQMLSAMGAHFVVASDGVEAMDQFNSQRFDLLILDIEMPRLSGLDVIKRVRACGDDRATVPIVALTAYALREHRERIAEAGADGMIPKPILGIEEFGEDLLRHSKRCAKAAKVTDGPAVDRAAIIDEVAYANLSRSIGPEMMEELLSKVRIDLEEVRSGIESGLEQTDMDNIRRASHVMISVSGAVGAVAAQTAAESLNKAANSEASADVAVLGPLCLTRIDDLLKVFDDRGFS